VRFREREIGRFLPSRWASEREEEMQAQLEARQDLWRKALMAALRKRDWFGRRFYMNEGISIAEWPEIAPLTPEERTLIIRELRKLLNTPMEVRSR
jgi:hypothetical protein